MPGWGESDPVSYQERNHPLAVAHLLDELDISTATLIGNSMGGGTTIRFGYEYPDRVKRLITMGSSSGRTIFGAGGFTERLKVLQQGYRDPTFDTSKKLVGIMTFDASFATDELIQQRADNVAAHPEHNQNFIDGIGKRAVVELDLDQVAGIQAPALLFHGRDDRVVSFENSLRLVSLIPNSRLVIINRCGHWLQIEHSDEFNRLVKEFIETPDRDGAYGCSPGNPNQFCPAEIDERCSVGPVARGDVYGLSRATIRRPHPTRTNRVRGSYSAWGEGWW